jgi:predicted nucleic acid-binding protein
MYLLDTDVLSELRKKERNAGVAKWFDSVRDSELHLSVVTILEVERGIELKRARDQVFATKLVTWLDFTLRAFGERVLPVTVGVVRRWARLAAQIGNKELDLAIAATALEHGLTVVTGNPKHFQPTGVSLLDPFHARAPRK